MILHPDNDNRGGDRMSTTSEQDFPPLPEYTQTTTQNQSWVNVILTKTESDGSTTQTFFIAKK